MSNKVIPLGDFASSISEGIVTGKNDVFLVSRLDAENLRFEKGILKLCVRGSEIKRYSQGEVSDFVIYPYINERGKTRVLSPKLIAEKYPYVFSYLQGRRKELSGRGYFEKSKKLWYELWCERDIDYLSKTKIIVPELSDTNRFTVVDNDIYYGDTVCGITLNSESPEVLLFLLGLLNSKLIGFYYDKATVPKASGFRIYKTMFLKNIPIRVIDSSDGADVARHDKMVALVEEMLDLHKRLAAARSDADKQRLQRAIDATDRKIDALVYDLYGLTDEEIKIVEDIN